MFLSRKRFGLTIGMLLSISLLVYACGGGGGSSSGGGGGGTTPISNATQGSQAASSGTTGAQSGTALSDIASSLGSAAGGGVFGLSKPMSPFTKQNPKYAKIVAMNNKVAHSKAMMKVANQMKATKAKAKTSFAVTVVPTEEVDCTDGGTLSTGGSFDDATGAFDLDLLFSDCREEGSQINGPVSMTATGTFDDTAQTGSFTMNMTLGNANTEFSIQDYEEINGNVYANLVGVMESTMTLITSFNMTSETAGSVTLEANGNASFDDFTGTMDIIFAGFEDESIFNDTNGTFSNNLNGAITQSQTDSDGTHTAAISYTDMTVSVTDNANGEAVSIVGTVAVNFTPDTDCGIEGTFSFDTETALQYNDGDSCPVAGHLIINGNTHVEFNSDQSVDVTVESETTSYASCNDLLDICGVEDFDESDTETVTVSGDTTTSGNSMLITLTWTDNGTDLSDMDLHVGYYSDPLATSGPADAVVAFHDPSATFGSASAVLDFDDTDGLGPEHVTVSSLPAGRYVIAVNSYDLDDATSATVTVTVKIGDSVYSFPTHSFQVADGDGTTSAAWHRVVDLQCISGTCTLVAPNTSLMVHDAANGGFKPKKGK
ncbi:MAG: hypothetical protein LLH30_13855 [Candidatus Manganitrophus sp. SA1]|nr:hypothetical protein [Candidatus Manganitrophus morganii]